MPSQHTLRVDAAPEKRFFIEMITKDIELIPAIVDLVDNSVDGARSLRPQGDFGGLWVHITADEQGFSIADNCGGIEADTARRYAFRFGRPSDAKPVAGSVGQFGIGMKRALFKLGDKFQIHSVAKSSSFDLEVDVNAWAKESGTDWTFQFSSVNDSKGGKAGERGTTITVSELNEAIKEDLGRPTVITRLGHEIALKHQFALSGGIDLMVNGIRLMGLLPRLANSAQIRPLNKTLTIGTGKKRIDARIVAGITAAVDREDEVDVGEAEQFAEVSQAGWYVYCNGRMVLEADRTSLTGWGVSTAAYHPQYRRFRGYVFLEAKDSSVLPWNTTKTSLDEDSPVFRTVQQEMFSALAAVAVAINRQKRERQTEDDESRRVMTRAFDSAAEVTVTDLAQSSTFIAPDPLPAPVARPTPSREINVQFRAPRDQMDAVIEHLDANSASHAGRLVFEYFVQVELDL